MDVNKAISKAIQAIHKVKPSIGDARMSEQHRKDYEEWLEVIHTLNSLKEKNKDR